MPVNKRKKNTRMRGLTTHGWGAKKKHRGSGNRGGRGMAGSGKRADQKKPSILNIYGNEYFGKRGLTSLKKIKKQKTINLFEIEAKLNNLAKKDGDFYVIDLSKYDKVLGTGNFNVKAKITCKSFSTKAKELIEKAGGETIICP